MKQGQRKHARAIHKVVEGLNRLMKQGGGKGKGSGFERTVCQDLSRLILPDSDETLFWRSAMSGGRSTVRHKQGKKDASQGGDITCIHEAGRWLTEYFVLECKFYRDLDIESGLLKGKGKLAQFWKEIETVAKRHHKHPLLIAKQNNTIPLLILNKKGVKTFQTFSQLPECLLISSILDASFFAYDAVVPAKEKRKRKTKPKERQV